MPALRNLREERGTRIIDVVRKRPQSPGHPAAHTVAARTVVYCNAPVKIENVIQLSATRNLLNALPVSIIDVAGRRSRTRSQRAVDLNDRFSPS